MIESDLIGIDSHGIGRLDMYLQRIKLGVQFQITKNDEIKDTETTAVWDGNHDMDNVVSYKTTRKAIEKVKKMTLLWLPLETQLIIVKQDITQQWQLKMECAE